MMIGRREELHSALSFQTRTDILERMLLWVCVLPSGPCDAQREESVTLSSAPLHSVGPMPGAPTPLNSPASWQRG